jgi:DNA-binding NtrC family response regulator
MVTTGRGLRSLAASGRFTLDLLYPLNVIDVYTPPLPKRRETSPYCSIALSTCTVRSSASRDPPWNGSLRAALMDYGWPGSATELGSVVQRLILSGRTRVTAADSRLSPARRRRASSLEKSSLS